MPADSPLYSHEKVTVTPHIAAVSLPVDVAEVFVDNLALLEAGEPLRGLVDTERGY